MREGTRICADMYGLHPESLKAAESAAWEARKRGFGRNKCLAYAIARYLESHEQSVSAIFDKISTSSSTLSANADGE